jgi:periplasmic copper chaperone A
MSRNGVGAFFLAGVVVTAALPASAQTYKAGALVIEAPWSRATPGAAQVAAGYLTVTNTGSVPDRLLAGGLSVAGRGEVHEMSHAGGVMRMRPVEGGVEIAPGSSIELKPGGYHLMFMDLKQGLKEGDRIAGTLTFEKAGAVKVEFAVRSIGAQNAGSPAHQR